MVLKGVLSASNFVSGSSFRIVRTVEGVTISSYPSYSFIVSFKGGVAVDYSAWIMLNTALEVEATVESDAEKFPETISYTSGLSVNGDLITSSASNFNAATRNILSAVSLLDLRTRFTMVKTQYM